MPPVLTHDSREQQDRKRSAATKARNSLAKKKSMSNQNDLDDLSALMAWLSEKAEMAKDQENEVSGPP